MSVEISLDTPLANALSAAIQPKLMEVGWASGSDDSALSEYIILMLVNGKTQEQIAAELSGELLNLPPDDPGALDFARWLFEQIGILNGQLNETQAAGNDAGAAGDMDTDMGAGDVSELNAPTGPRSMRAGGQRGGREKRMMGHMNKAMDRTTDASMRRIRADNGGRINTHNRGPPNGPRGGANRMGPGNPRGNQMHMGNMANMANMQSQMANPQNWAMPGAQPANMDIMAMIQEQNQMMYQLSRQLMNNRGNGNRGRGGRHDNNRRRQQNAGEGDKAEGEGDDVDMAGAKREPANPEESVCKYNLKCTNRECKFAHQSPAAPPNTPVDVNDVCTYAAACKNWKCTGRHPSPATKLAHQGEQDCKFFPNCQNPRCPFKHPSMPLCRNGGDCKTEGCKFTHVKTKCKFTPCLNPNCAFLHDDGQQGGFKDKVWTPGSGEHVSERKFTDEHGVEELVKPEGDAMNQDATAQDTEVIV